MKFIGSLYFAILLIGCTLLFVVAGTFLESFSGSHLFAATLTYQNPIFRILLWLYFVNILFSALNRYPFQKKHIPFLMTHLGLLLLLFGVFVKNHFGVQGMCALAEGCGTSQIYLNESYALHIETPDAYTLASLKKGRLGRISTGMEDLQLTLLEWIPHAEEKIEGFIKGNWGHILGLPPFEVTTHKKPTLHTPEYLIYAYKNEIQDSIVFSGTPSLFFVQDHKNGEHLVAFNEQGERYETTLNGKALYIYDKGYGGYAAFAKLPAHFPQLELVAPLTRSWKPSPLPKKREEATPCIRLLASTPKKSEIVTFSYDKYAQKFKWPILDGQYLLRFQSYRQEIPIHMRLHSAKQINYPGTNKPYSYEAKVSFDGQEQRLSMNKVFEKKGYRFYLANLVSSPSGAHHIQIIVNHDPAKYLLTYPGAACLVAGILLLYLRKHYASLL